MCVGGGFRIGYATQYLRSFLHIIEHVKNKHGLTARILSVEYTLTPEARYPTAQKECVRSYEYLVNELGIDPSKIIVGKYIYTALRLHSFFLQTLIKDICIYICSW